MDRTYEESCELLDQIVGRCVRDEGFAREVLLDPDCALREYKLLEHELDDFRALSNAHCEEASAGWQAIRSAIALLSGKAN